MSVAPHAFFMPADGNRAGQRLCLYHAPQAEGCRGALVYVHPFAEELNKSRRMAALQSRAFAQAGYAVLQIDLLGCGDSSGDFGDATWDDWLADVAQAAEFLRQRHPADALWLWGLRAGSLLACEAARQIDLPCNLLFWQPATAGNVLLQQFLRLKAAGDMLEGKTKGVMDVLRQRLAAGSTVEVAGYTLSPRLAAGLEAATLKPPPQGGRMEWIELSTRADASLSPASECTLAAWRDGGFDVRSRIVRGLAFWQTTEIEEAPALIDASVDAIAAPVESVAA